MAVKRPLPYPHSQPTLTLRNSAAVTPGNFVDIASTGKIAKTSNTDDEYIGIVDYDHAYFANSGTSTYAADATVPVILRGPVMNTVVDNGTAIAIGDFVKLGASGGVIQEATAGTKTLNTIGIALTAASGTGAEVRFVKL